MPPILTEENLPAQRSIRLRLLAVVNLLLILSLACSLPGVLQGSPTPTPAEQTTSSEPAPEVTVPKTPPTPLPPALVETYPPPGAELPLSGPITLYFNQPMDTASVEGALSGQPNLSGRFNWQGDSQVSFTPDSPFSPGTNLAINLSSTARSQNGLGLLNPLTLTYRTVGFLELSQTLPEPGSIDINPTSAVVASFNRPVVPLGSDSASGASQAPAFTISAPNDPEPSGHGEWVNTSTYIFYPEPALAGGTVYTVRLNPELTGVDGSPLAGEDEQEPEQSAEWSFTTADPRLVSIEPAPFSTAVRLDQEIKLTFNQPMDSDSVTANFSLLGPDGEVVAGEMGWNADFTEFTFTPTSLFPRFSRFTALLPASTQARGGTQLEEGFQSNFTTSPTLGVLETEPAQGGVNPVYNGVTLRFTSQLPDEDLLQYFTISPRVPDFSAYLMEDMAVVLYGNFSPATSYSLTVSGLLEDTWGGRMEEPFTLEFTTAPLDPDLRVTLGTDVLFMTSQENSLLAQATNISALQVSVGSVPLEDFLLMLGPNGWDIRQTYQPSQRSTLAQAVSGSPNRSEVVEVSLTPNDQPLSPGLYYVKINIEGTNNYGGPYLLVSSDIHLTFKSSTSDVFVWAVDLRDQSPVPGAPVTVYDENGAVIARGITDQEGIFRSPIDPLVNAYSSTFAVLGQPGEAVFSLALSNWSFGINPWDFGLLLNYNPTNNQKTYLYTDRPIYRPGDTIYFRLISRQRQAGRYTLPDAAPQTIQVYDEVGQELAAFELPLSAYGTAHGEYTLLPEAQPGYYRLGDGYDAVWFQVADYRKPEINLQVSLDKDEILAGERLSAFVNARYFFDAPASNQEIRWAVYAAPETYSLPGYRVGALNLSWLNPYSRMYMLGMDPLGFLVSNGDAVLGRDGTLTLDVPVQPGELIPPTERYRLTLEVTLTDESGLPVSGRASVRVNPADFIIGIKADTWTPRAEQQAGFEVFVAGWEGQPAGEKSLRAEFKKVTWIRQDAATPYISPEYIPEYTQVGSADFQTGADGLARVAFTPPEPGTYQLDIYGQEARSEVLLWVGGPGTAIWPNLPNQRMRLAASQTSYSPGETASVFIPNDMGSEMLALVTLEREEVLQHELITIDAEGMDYTFPIESRHIPNIYVSVTLLGDDDQGNPDFRQGYLNLSVNPAEQVLNVELLDIGRGTSLAETPALGPGEELTLGLRVTDQAGQPVEGEFSLSVVDLAVLALADPNAPDILPALYGERPLGVRTGLGLAAFTHRSGLIQDGVGGGGGGEGMLPSVVRERFPDTAYWNATLTTGANGEAQVTLTLPDTLTTWRVQARGLSAATQVGEATADIVATKQLLVRPVAPRFLVRDDHVQLSAIVHNNAETELEVEVSLQATGVRLDDPTQSIQVASMAPGSQVRLDWWGTVLDAETANLVFSAVSGSLQDAARPAGGSIPILRYSAPQTFATSGTLDSEGERLELVSLPLSFEASGGKLDVELSPSLAAAVLNGLSALERFPYETNEQTISRFLPNLETYRALQTFGIEVTELQTRLERNLDQGLMRLIARQNEDGGWGWNGKGKSEAYVSTYILFGLIRAMQNGISVDAGVINRAVEYLRAQMTPPDISTPTWQLDRLAFGYYVLALAGSGDLAAVSDLYENHREQLNPWAQAFLALSMESLSPSDERVKVLLSDLQASAVRSATGAHWEMASQDFENFSSPIYNSAVVIYALAQREPAAQIIPDALRYLMDHRQTGGCWSNSYDTAWSLMAAIEVMKGTGELGGAYAFSAVLNGTLIANGQAGGSGTEVNSVTATVPLSSLYPRDPNGLNIRRDPGTGRLYYTASLQVDRPVETVEPLNRGLEISRTYYPHSRTCPERDCEPVQEAGIGEMVTARVTLVLPNDAYYLMVEDYLPGGTEILDLSLKTSQLGKEPEPGLEGEPEPEPLYDYRRPFEDGWGWWLFQGPQIFADHIAWSADYLPAGTYTLTYDLVITHPGEYRVLPARAWEFYFPEVQGTSAGTIFEVSIRE